MINVKFPLLPHQKYIRWSSIIDLRSHSMKNVAFHSLLRWKMIIILSKKFSQPHLWGWENVLFERGSEGVKGDISGNSTCHRGVYAPPCKRDCIHMAHSTWIGWCVGDCWSNWKGTIYKAVQIIGRLIHYASNSNNQQPSSKIWIILRG